MRLYHIWGENSTETTCSKLKIWSKPSFARFEERIVRAADATRGRAAVVAAEIAERIGEEIGKSMITQAEAEEYGRRYTQEAFTFALDYEPQITDAFRDNFNIDADALGTAIAEELEAVADEPEQE